MRHEGVFLLVLPSGAGGCLYCSCADEARDRARQIAREGWLLRYLKPSQPPKRVIRAASTKVALVETFGCLDPAALPEALSRAGTRLGVRLELSQPEKLPAGHDARRNEMMRGSTKLALRLGASP